MVNAFFRIPKIKDDAMRIVCVILDILIGGMFLAELFSL